MGIIPFILDHKELIFIFILIAVILFELLFIKGLQLEIQHAKSDNSTLVMKYNTADQRANLLASQIDKQNMQIEQMQKDEAARIKAHAIEIAMANAAADKYKSEAEALLKKKPVSADVCTSANVLIDEEINNAIK